MSIEALQKVPKIKKPRLLSSIKYDVHRPKYKDLMLNGVFIRIAPDVIIKAEYGGEIVYGGVKFHVKNTKPFDINQAELVSSLLFKFLNGKIAKKGEVVLPELCFCFDVFSERIVSAPIDLNKHNAIIKDICEEIKNIWPNSA